VVHVVVQVVQVRWHRRARSERLAAEAEAVAAAVATAAVQRTTAAAAAAVRASAVSAAAGGERGGGEVARCKRLRASLFGLLFHAVGLPFWRSRLSLRFLASCLRFCFWARQSVLVRGECGERRHGQQGTRQSWLSWQLVKQRHVVLGASAALLVARARLVWAMRCVAVRVCAGIGGAECQAGGVQRVREGRPCAYTC